MTTDNICHLNGANHYWVCIDMEAGQYWCNNCGALGQYNKSGEMEWVSPHYGRKPSGGFLSNISDKEFDSKNDLKHDVHTEHCCVNCGCKYGDADCTVKTKKLEQSFPCNMECLNW